LLPSGNGSAGLYLPVSARHDGVKRLRHPEVGDLELIFQSLDLPLSGRAVCTT
jgi:hypothetical protein